MTNRKFSTNEPRAVTAGLLIALALSACNSSSNPPLAVASPPAPILPASATFSKTIIVAPSPAAAAKNIMLPLPPASGYSGTALLSAASIPAGLKLSVTYSNAPPAGIAPLARDRLPLSIDYNSDVAYVSVTANEVIDILGKPHFNFILPASFNVPGVVYYAAIRENSAWVDGYSGPGTVMTVVGGTGISIDGRFGFELVADVPIDIALYGRWTTAPTPAPANPPASPTPSPTNPPASPTPSPSPSVAPSGPVAAPSALAFTALGSAAAQRFVMSEPAYTGTFAQTNTCLGIASIATTDGTTFTVTPIAVGACAITVTDSSLVAIKVGVNVTTSTIGVH